MNPKTLAIALAGLIAGIVVAVVVTTGNSGGSPSSTVSASWMLASAPADAVHVASAKTSAQPGDTIALRGKIGGRLEPMSSGSPVFTIVDLAVKDCNQKMDDGCPTPWDYCCTPPEVLTVNSATVQLVDAQGNSSPTDPIAGGLKPLDDVIVVGTVGPRPSEQVLTVKATGVYRATAGG